MDSWLQVILTFISVFCVNAETAKVDIQPKNPLVAAGSSVIINCSTVRNADEDIDNGPYFVFSGSLDLVNISFQVEKLDHSTVQLNISGAQRNMSSGLIECRHKSSDVASDSTLLIVADKPKKPTGDCQVYNWRNMTCYWTPQNDNGIPTNVSLLFNREKNLEPIFHCPHYNLYKENSCSWLENDSRKPQDSFMLIPHHNIVLLANNQLGFDYTVISFHPSDHVQPGSVTNLNCSEISSRSCSLVWTSPFGGKKLFYRVTLTSSDRNETETYNVTSGEPKVRLQLTDLIPNTNYQVTVGSIPIVRNDQKGFWSEPQMISFLTAADVPAMTPPVTPGGYSVLKQGQVQFFWQPLPKRWANGNVTGYRIKKSRNTEFLTSHLNWTNSSESFSNLNSYKTQNVSLVTSKLNEITVSDIFELETSTTFMINENVSYWVTVEANTSAGLNESLVPQKVIIPHRNIAPQHPDIYIVSVNSYERDHFYFNWSAVSIATGYTLYWRSRGRNQPQSYYEWVNIGSSHTTHRLHLPDRSCEDVRFDFSVESILPSGQTVSSGMKPFDAIYFKDGEIRMPEDIKISEDLFSDSQTVMWSVPDDGMYCQKSAYITHFIIRFCNVSWCHEMVVDGSARDAKLTGLSAGVTYSVRLKSRTYNQESGFTAAVNVSTPFVNIHKPVSVTDFQETIATTVIVVTCVGVMFALLIIMLIGCHFYITSKNAIKIVIPKKLSLSKLEINHGDSTSYTSQLMPAGASCINRCHSISDITGSPADIHSICSSWNSDQANF